MKKTIQVYCTEIEADMISGVATLQDVDLNQLADDVGRGDLANELGWEFIKEYFAPEIEELINEKSQDEN